MKENRLAPATHAMTQDQKELPLDKGTVWNCFETKKKMEKQNKQISPICFFFNLIKKTINIYSTVTLFVLLVYNSPLKIVMFKLCL